MKKLNTAILISGRGSNLRALLEASTLVDFPARISLVISNVPGAEGLQHAEAAAIPNAVVDHTEFVDRESFEHELNVVLERANIELICLAGFMRLLTNTFVSKWFNKLINIHPSLLPSYKGLHTHKRVLADGVRLTGCTVHFVRGDLDFGPIIVQAAVPVRLDDDVETLSTRVLVAEHLCYPYALGLVASGKATVVNEKVKINGTSEPNDMLINPAIN